MFETLQDGIELFESLQKKATDRPWYLGDVFEDAYGCKNCPIGPHDMSEKEVKHPYEDTIAEFWGTEHNCEANAKLAIVATMLVPMLIEQLKSGAAPETPTNEEVRELRKELENVHKELKSQVKNTDALLRMVASMKVTLERRRS